MSLLAFLPAAEGAEAGAHGAEGAAGGEGFVAPSAASFDYPGLFGVDWLTKPVLMLFFAVLVISVFFVLVTRRMSLVPSKMQFVGEGAYTLVRNGLGRDIIGSHDFLKFVPLLLTLFSLILVSNIFGIVPLIQFPTMSRVAFPYVLAGVVYLTFNIVGIRKHGLGGYFRMMTMPPGVPTWIYPLLIPIEFASNFIFRPLTLSLRLFANMFAGHLLLLVFVLGAEHLLLHSEGLNILASPFAFIFALVFTFFEALVEVLQAYIFTLLAALYIAGSLADEH